MPRPYVGITMSSGVGEVRGDLAQAGALAGGLAHQRDVALLQVAHAAVDQLRAPARRAGGEVDRLEERHRQAAQCGVARDAGARDAAADDDEIEIGGG